MKKILVLIGLTLLSSASWARINGSYSCSSSDGRIKVYIDGYRPYLVQDPYRVTTLIFNGSDYTTGSSCSITDYNMTGERIFCSVRNSARNNQSVAKLEIDLLGDSKASYANATGDYFGTSPIKIKCYGFSY